MAPRIQILATLATLDAVVQNATERAAAWGAENYFDVEARFNEAARFNRDTRIALSKRGGRADKVAPFNAA